ncbi:hypothetical protein [Methylobacterium oxalidis]|uniref:hypothetical protein n=1 Tax=Methylobacterium oxalidis TaxID=944322 RepID=UPI003314C96A
MRVVSVGLVAALLSVSAATAGECKLDGLELTATRGGTWEVDAERPDLIGKPFKVVRVSSAFSPTQAPGFSDPRDIGGIYALVESGGEKFVIHQVHSWEISPSQWDGSSAESDAAAKSVVWDQRASEAERRRFTGYFEIGDGPLSGLMLAPTNCGAGWAWFRNARFGTIAEWPSQIFKAEPEPGNGDGRTFKSRDGAELRIFGSHNPEESFKAYKKWIVDIEHRRRIKITYMASGKDWIAYSGREGKSIVYHKTIEGCDALHTVFAEYPWSLRKKYDPLVASISGALRCQLPGRLCPKSKEECATDEAAKTAAEERAAIDRKFAGSEAVSGVEFLAHWRRHLGERVHIAHCALRPGTSQTIPCTIFDVGSVIGLVELPVEELSAKDLDWYRSTCQDLTMKVACTVEVKGRIVDAGDHPRISGAEIVY